ncbi:MAG: isoleucine--tRNA ligase [Pseudomonadota bacterium]
MPSDTQTDDASDTARDYRDTLFLPRTDFPMRGGLPKREPEWIARWDEMGLYQRMRADAAARGAEPFVYHDGPPYANGHIHIGTAMNKILKDTVVRSQQMMGRDATFIPGWDCHGLPIEWKVEEAYRAKGKTKDDVDPAEFRRACRDYAAEWVAVQKAEFRQLGVEAEWDHPYLTMAFDSEASIVEEFLRVAMGGRLVRGAKPIMWSPVERTALAEAEVEYHDRKVPVIWVKFPVVSDDPDLNDTSVVIWTTTPWTIPANQAVSFNRDITYGIYEVGEVSSEEELGFKPYARTGERLIIADALAESVREAAKVKTWIRRGDISGVDVPLLKHPLHTLDPFFQHDIPLFPGDHVTDDAGTGFVHTAPAHGEDDFNVWVESGRKASEIRQIVDPDGCYNADVPAPLAGLDIIRTSGKKRGQPGKANDTVIKLLAESGNLLARSMTTIRDAHSWRSKAPVIRRATPQWFIAMDQPGKDGTVLRDTVMTALEGVDFFPPQGRNRLEAMVKDRPDWLVSRQRNWGVPLTIFVNQNGDPHTAALSETDAAKLNANIIAAVAKDGVEAWFSNPIDSFFTGTGVSPEGWDKVTDVLDVWFDSGTTHAFCLRKRGVIDEDTGQANLYLEGSDQHRGWFQSSLLESCATRGIAPYKHILTHGMVVDAEGKKMSKSIGNTVEPSAIQKQFGIEILRLWTASGDFTEDLRISDEILKGTVESYRRLRNTLRYLLGALDGFDAAESRIPGLDPGSPPMEPQPSAGVTDDLDTMPGLDRWVLHRLAELDALIRDAYATYDFKRVMAALINFATIDLSAVYFDIRKDSLYCDPTSATQAHWDEAAQPFGNRRRAARTVMAAVLERLLCWLAPVMPFTTEEAFLESPFSARADSVHLLVFPDTPDTWYDETLAQRWDAIFKVRRVVTGALEIERKDKRIGSSLEAAPIVHIGDQALLDAFDGEDPAELFITSGATFETREAPKSAFTLEDTPGIAVVPARATGQKCARSWKYFDPATALDGYPDITPRDALAVKALAATGLS